MIGYLSATVEWAATRGEPEAWRDFWQGPDARIYNIIGKDNVPFHTVIWPAILLGAGGLQPALRRARQPVHHDVGQQGQHQPALGRVGQRLT